jgi:toxin secretion/phage lysis holin
MKAKNIVEYACAGVGTCITYLFGPWSDLLTAMVVIMAIDIFTAIIVAAKGKSPNTASGGISSNAFFNGLFNKIFSILLIIIGQMLANVMHTVVVREFVIYALIFKDLWSIFENYALMGYYVPPILLKTLEVLKKKVEDGPEGGNEDAPDK